MTWTIEFEQAAAKEFKKLDPATRRRIRAYFEQRVLGPQGPRTYGKPLKGALAGFWRYRIGNYRVVCRIEDDRLIVLIVRVAHRKAVYDS